MRVVIGCLGGVVGTVVGFLAFQAAFCLTHPGYHCLGRLNIVTVTRFAFLGLLVGAVTGPFVANRLVTWLGNVLMTAFSGRRGRRKRRRRPG